MTPALVGAPSRLLRLVLESRPESAIVAGSAVGGVCRGHLGYDEQETYQVELAVVEAVTNVIRHAYRDRPRGTVEVNLDAQEGALLVEILDQGEPLTEAALREARRPPALDPSRVETLPESGRGLFVVSALMDEVAYSSGAGVNRMALVHRREGGGAMARPAEPHWGGSHLEARDGEHRLRLESLLRELQFAREIQRSILPAPRGYPGAEVFSEVRPALHVGGDFFDVVTYQEPPGLLCLIGDVMGKGMPAALTMVMALTLLREVARRSRSPRELFEEANELLFQRLESMVLWNSVSAAAVYVDASSRTLRYAKAGHENLLLWREATGEVEILSGRGFFLGMFEGGDYEEYETPLAVGDKVVLYTDGVPNARNLDGEEFGPGRLEALVRTFGRDSASDLGERILEALGEHQAVREPSDDVALVILAITDLGADVVPGKTPAG